MLEGGTNMAKYKIVHYILTSSLPALAVRKEPDYKPEVREEASDQARLLHRLLSRDYEIAATVICERPSSVKTWMKRQIRLSIW